MRTNEILDGIRQGRDAGKSFIKWWRIENDFTDFETFDSFIVITSYSIHYTKLYETT